MSEEKELRRYITVTSGIRGYFAVLIGVFYSDQSGTYQDPIETGIGSYKTREGAVQEGKMWAKDEGLEFKE